MTVCDAYAQWWCKWRWWIWCLVFKWKKLLFSEWQRHTWRKRTQSSPNRSWTYDLVINTLVALPLCYNHSSCHRENCCKTLEIYFLGLYSLQIIAAENLLQSPPVISHQMFKCLTHKSDWHLISLYNVNPEYQSHKNMGNDHHLEKLSLVKKILFVNPLGNV